MKRIKNYTPHNVVIVNENNEVISTFPSEGIARVSSATEVVDNLEGVLLTRTSFGIVEGLPEKEDDTLLIVSRMVASAAMRDDLVVPGLQVRDDEGRIVGCKSLDLTV